MRILFTKSDAALSKAIRRVTNEPVSHVAIEAAGYVIHSNFKGVIAQPLATFKSEVVFRVAIPEDYPKLLGLFAEEYRSGYDLGALLYLGLRSGIPWLPKKNLWQCSGMYLCTEWVTKYLDGQEDSEITPYKLYLRLQGQV